MADFKLRAPPRLRMAAGFQIDGAFGLTDVPVQLAGNAIARAQSTAALLRGVNLGSAAAASAQATAALVKGIRLGGAAVGGASAIGVLNWNIVPAPVFAFGNNGQYDLRSTPPAGFSTGGVYLVDYTGTQLPSGLSLAESGVISDGGAAISDTYNVFFNYFEPGALPILTLHTGIVDGNLPYMATVYPCEGVVPSGQSLTSPDDANLRASVLSTWPDGSAQVMVLAGQKSVSTGSAYSIRLRPGAASGAALTTTDIAAVFTSGIAVDFGAGAQVLNSWASPDRVWWANSQVICARYRLGCGVGVMEAVIDVHAFAGGRAFVEVVIENGKMSSSAPVKPASQTYTNATVSVNGTTIATVSSPSVDGAKYTNAAHEAFRAWYCSGWIGGNPGIDVTHDTTYLQAHPLFFRPVRTSTYNFATQSFSSSGNGHQLVVSQPYGSDSYAPWWTGRHRDAGMGAAASDVTISMYPEWEEHYIHSGSKYVRNAVIQNALALLSYSINYRDSTTNDVNSPEAIKTRTRQDNSWPNTGDSLYPSFDEAHQPAVGLMAFLCRPSPCFIELAQKLSVWDCTYQTNSLIFYQTRSVAWCMRNIGFAIFLTPDTQTTVKSGLRSAFMRNVDRNTAGFKNSLQNPLGIVMDSWSPTVSTFKDLVTSDRGNTQSLWMHHYCASVWHILSKSKILRDADQTTFDALADWACLQPIRYINEQPNGGWRYIRHFTEVGQNPGDRLDIGQSSTWTAQISWIMGGGNPPTVGGTWYGCQYGNDNDPGTATYTYTGVGWVANGYGDYIDRFWMALSCAVERGVTGADTAWATVNDPTNGVTNLDTWLNRFQTTSQYGWYPRNKP